MAHPTLHKVRRNRAAILISQEATVLLRNSSEDLHLTAVMRLLQDHLPANIP